MAKLHEERRMVKALRDFYKKTRYSHPDSRGVRLKNIAQDAIPEKDFSGAVFQKMTLRDRVTFIFRRKYFESPNYLLDKANRNNALYKSCRDDGFIDVCEKLGRQIPNRYSFTARSAIYSLSLSLSLSRIPLFPLS